MLLGEQLGFGFTERKSLRSARLHLAEDEHPRAEDDDVGQNHEDQASERRAFPLRANLHALFLQPCHLAIGILDRKEDGEARSGPVVDLDTGPEVAGHKLPFLHGHGGDVPALDLLVVLSIGDLRGGFLRARHIGKQGSGKQDEQHPEGELFRGLAPFSWSLRFLRHW